MHKACDTKHVILWFHRPPTTPTPTPNPHSKKIVLRELFCYLQGSIVDIINTRWSVPLFQGCPADGSGVSTVKTDSSSWFHWIIGLLCCLYVLLASLPFQKIFQVLSSYLYFNLLLIALFLPCGLPRYERLCVSYIHPKAFVILCKAHISRFTALMKHQINAIIPTEGWSCRCTLLKCKYENETFYIFKISLYQHRKYHFHALLFQGPQVYSLR